MDRLSTPRLRLRPLAAGDASALHRLRGDPAVMRFWDWPADADEDATRHVVAAMLAEVAQGRARVWSARLAGGGGFVGVFDLGQLDVEPGVADLGFMVAPEQEGQGLAREACEALLAEARASGFDALTARTHAGNTRSERLLQRLGFTVRAAASAMEVRPGVRVDCALWRLPLALPSSLERSDEGTRG